MFIILIFIVLITFVALSVISFKTASSDLVNTDPNQKRGDCTSLSRKQWWAKKRVKYNIALMIAGFAAFVLYAVLGVTLIAPHDNGFEVTLFTTVFQGTIYFLVMLVVNLLFNLGPYIDRTYNKDNSDVFRQRVFNLGFWLSVMLPFLIPALLVVEYLVRFAGHR